MYQNKLSADPLALVLGIISLFILFFACCCGLMIPVSATLAIVGWVMANKSLREFKQFPDAFTAASRSNVTIGRIICIVGVVLNGLLVLVFIVGLLFFDSDIFKEFKNRIEKSNNKVVVYTSDSTFNDTVTDDGIQEVKALDSVALDSIEVKL